MDARRAWSDRPLLAFDLETTGVDPLSDAPVSFALLEMSGGSVVSQHAALVDPGRPIPPGATAVHGITTEQATAEGMALDAAVRFLGAALIDASVRGVPVVGMKLDFDLTMLDAQYRRCVGRSLGDDGFAGPVLDALVLDRHLDRYRKGRRTLSDLCAEYGVVIGHAHDASEDARAALEVVLALCRRYPELSGTELPELHRSQVTWHREWVESFGAWRRSRGLSPVGERGAAWPISSAAEPPSAGGGVGTAAPAGAAAPAASTSGVAGPAGSTSVAVGEQPPLPMVVAR